MVRSWPEKESKRRGGQFKQNKGGRKGTEGSETRDWFHVVVRAQAYYREDN